MVSTTRFLERLRARAAATPRRIAFPEAEEPRTAKAVIRLAGAGLVRPVVVGHPASLPPDLLAQPGVEFVDAARVELPGSAEASAGRGSPPFPPGEPLAAASRLLALGEVDGVVAGAARPTPEVIRAGLRLVGVASGTETVSSAFYMLLRAPTAGGEEVLTFTDAGVVPAPSALQLAEIASAACEARRRIVGDEPRVAFLSYSTLGSAEGGSVERVREAVERFRARVPGVIADGELQADAALVPDVAARKAPASPLAGRANVLVFPDLDAGNIAYKLVQRLAGARALGPILQGLRRPLNDLSRGADEEDIELVACITALMGGRTA